jgi:hypothetical protein
VLDRWCLTGGVNVLAQGSTMRTRFAGSALKCCAGRRMTRTTRTRTRTLLDATRGLEASSTASGDSLIEYSRINNKNMFCVLYTTPLENSCQVGDPAGPESARYLSCGSYGGNRGAC